MSKHHRKHWTTSDRTKWQPIMAAMVKAGASCSKCGQPVGTAPWDIDHLIPISQGGGNHAGNLHPAHRSCNRKAGNKQTQAIRYGTSERDERGRPSW